MRIGLTGTIGSGKTAVANMLRLLGAEVLDADETARSLMKAGSPLCGEIKARWGDSVFLPNGELDRRALAARVFAVPEELAELNAIVHPAVYAELEARASATFSRDADAVVFFDVPLLMETGHDKLMDAVWLVTADDEVRIERVMNRDGVTREEVVSRIAAQMPQEEKIRRATVVIDNNGSVASLYCCVGAHYGAVMKRNG